MKILIFIFLLLAVNALAVNAPAQTSLRNSLYGAEEHSRDTLPVTRKANPTAPGLFKAGGIFIAPFAGLDYPVKEYAGNSKYGIALGAKLEYGSLKIYPFVPYIFFQTQTNPGNDTYKTVNLLNSLDTKILSAGGGTYILINKYLKMNFTMPFLIAEFRYMMVTRAISPVSPQLGLTDESLFAAGAGLGFTLYIFDISGTYNAAKNYSSVTVKIQFHFPLMKF
jgi:hypothetical protein